MSMTDAELQTLENLGHGDAAEEIRELRGDLAALRNDLSDALDCKNGTGPTALSLVIEERDSLRAELAASREREARMKRDAERYRWLRDVSVPPHNFYLSVPDEFAGVRYTPTEVDAAIDAAIDALRGEVK